MLKYQSFIQFIHMKVIDKVNGQKNMIWRSKNLNTFFTILTTFCWVSRQSVKETSTATGLQDWSIQISEKTKQKKEI